MHETMTPDMIRARTPIDTERTIRFLLDPSQRTSTRVGEIHATILDHSGDVLYVGRHPDLFALSFDSIVEVI